MIVIICKVIALVAMFIMVWLVGELYKVFEYVPNHGNYKGAVAVGLIAEVVLIVLLAIKVITG